MSSSRNGGRKSSKSRVYSKSRGLGNSGKWKSNTAKFENKVKNKKRQLSDLNTEGEYGLDNEESD